MSNNETFNYAVSCLEAIESYAGSMRDINKWMACGNIITINGYTSDRFLGMSDAYEIIRKYAHEMLRAIEGE